MANPLDFRAPEAEGVKFKVEGPREEPPKSREWLRQEAPMRLKVHGQYEYADPQLLWPDATDFGDAIPAEPTDAPA